MFGKCGGGGRRSAAREIAPVIAVFTTVTRSHGAELVDLSSTGARLRGDDLPLKGEELMVTVGRVRGFGRVVWSRYGQCGVAFDSDLDETEVEEVRARAAENRGFTIDTKAALDDWNVGLAR